MARRACHLHRHHFFCRLQDPIFGDLAHTWLVLLQFKGYFTIRGKLTLLELFIKETRTSNGEASTMPCRHVIVHGIHPHLGFGQGDTIWFRNTATNTIAKQFTRLVGGQLPIGITAPIVAETEAIIGRLETHIKTATRQINYLHRLRGGQDNFCPRGRWLAQHRLLDSF